MVGLIIQYAWGWNLSSETSLVLTITVKWSATHKPRDKPVRPALLPSQLVIPRFVYQILSSNPLCIKDGAWPWSCWMKTSNRRAPFFVCRRYEDYITGGYSTFRLVHSTVAPVSNPLSHVLLLMAPQISSQLSTTWMRTLFLAAVQTAKSWTNSKRAPETEVGPRVWYPLSPRV